jgi:Family of unknown function (DUF5522)
MSGSPDQDDSRENTKMGRQANEDPNAPPALDPEDYYFEGPYLVFTAAYHLKRGSCCGSGCRHCPWRENAAGQQQARDQNHPE